MLPTVECSKQDETKVSRSEGQQVKYQLKWTGMTTEDTDHYKWCWFSKILRMMIGLFRNQAQRFGDI